MAIDFQPPPTYDMPIQEDEQGRAVFSPIWLNWFLSLAQVLNSFSGGGGTAEHNMLSGLQGGTTDEYYHLTEAQHANLAGGCCIVLYYSSDTIGNT